MTTLEPSRDKDGHITLRLRVLGPRDRAIEMVQNLEHSRRFLSPRIMDESSESSGGPNQRFEPVSASSGVTFDVLADYIPASPGERHAAKAAAQAASTVTTQNTLPPGAFRPPYTGGARRGAQR